MGQYHVIVNIDKREYLNPYSFGQGEKLMEFLWDGGYHHAMGALGILLSNSPGRGGGDLQSSDREFYGRWAGDRIVVAGDYANLSDPGESEANEATLYTLCRASERPSVLDGEVDDPERVPKFRNISKEVLATILAAEGSAHDEFLDGLAFEVAAYGFTAEDRYLTTRVEAYKLATGIYVREEPLFAAKVKRIRKATRDRRSRERRRYNLPPNNRRANAKAGLSK